GYFQSYESTEHEVEVAVRVRRVFGRYTERTFRGQPGQPLFQQIKSSVDSTISSASVLMLAPSRLSEARAQLNAGKDLHRLAVGADDMLIPIGPGRYGMQ